MSANREIKLDELTWLQERQEVIGASEVAIVLGVSKWGSPFSLYCKKLGLAPLDTEESEAARWGKHLEPVIADAYAEETGRKLIDHGRYTLKRHAQLPFLGATLDREIVDAPEGPGVLEIKTAGAFLAHEWTDEPPLAYQLQLQAQLAVMGPRYKWGSIAALIGGQTFKWCDIPRRDDVIAVIEQECAEFWRRVQKEDPPPVDGSVATSEALRALYPGQNGESVILPAEAEEWDRIRKEAHEEIEKWAAKKLEVENRLRAAIGSASFGLLPGGGKYSLKEVTKKEYTVKASSYRALRRLDK